MEAFNEEIYCLDEVTTFSRMGTNGNARSRKNMEEIHLLLDHLFHLFIPARQFNFRWSQVFVHNFQLTSILFICLKKSGFGRHGSAGGMKEFSLQFDRKMRSGGKKVIQIVIASWQQGFSIDGKSLLAATCLCLGRGKRCSVKAN